MHLSVRGDGVGEEERGGLGDGELEPKVVVVEGGAEGDAAAGAQSFGADGDPRN